jgi:hypothetical protein
MHEPLMAAITTEDVISDEPIPATASHVPVPEDTAFRCLLTLIMSRTTMRLLGRAVRGVSDVHPARRAYSSALDTWQEQTRKMPWRGFVPTGRLISPTQLLWVAVVLLALNAAIYIVDLPHVPMFGVLRHHVPRLSLTSPH